MLLLVQSLWYTEKGGRCCRSWTPGVREDIAWGSNKQRKLSSTGQGSTGDERRLAWVLQGEADAPWAETGTFEYLGREIGGGWWRWQGESSDGNAGLNRAIERAEEEGREQELQTEQQQSREACFCGCHKEDI